MKKRGKRNVYNVYSVITVSALKIYRERSRFMLIFPLSLQGLWLRQLFVVRFYSIIVRREKGMRCASLHSQLVASSRATFLWIALCTRPNSFLTCYSHTSTFSLLSRHLDSRLFNGSRCSVAFCRMSREVAYISEWTPFCHVTFTRLK